MAVLLACSQADAVILTTDPANTHTQSGAEDWYLQFFTIWGGGLNAQNRYRSDIKFDIATDLAGWSSSSVNTATLHLYSESDGDDDAAGVVEQLTSNPPPLYSAGVSTSVNHTWVAGWNTIDVTPIVKNWLDGDPDYGFRLRLSDEFNGGNQHPFTDEAYTGSNNGHYLTVIPEPSTFALAGFGLLGCLAAFRRRRSGNR